MGPGWVFKAGIDSATALLAALSKTTLSSEHFFLHLPSNSRFPETAAVLLDEGTPQHSGVLFLAPPVNVSSRRRVLDLYSTIHATIKFEQPVPFQGFR
jgi:hypothetical protein